MCVEIILLLHACIKRVTMLMFITNVLSSNPGSDTIFKRLFNSSRISTHINLHKLFLLICHENYTAYRAGEDTVK